MSIQEEVLHAAVRICRRRGTWIFSPNEVVRALPHLNPASVRTHVISRCCVNAPKNHPHRLGYFRRVGRGRYEVMPMYHAERPASHAVAERTAVYGRSRTPTLHETIHAVVRRDRKGYVAECLEAAVVSRGRTLDELVTTLGEAVRLYLEGRDPRLLGLVPSPRLVVQYDVTSGIDPAVGPFWKRPRVRVAMKGTPVAQTIVEERRLGR